MAASGATEQKEERIKYIGPMHGRWSRTNSPNTSSPVVMLADPSSFTAEQV